MESEKVKEIKKALEQQGNCGIMYEVNDQKRTCKFINYTDILTLINELESENERLKRDYVVQAYEKLSERHNKLKRNFKNIEKFFKEKLKEKVNANNVDYFVESIKILENTIKEMLKENE